MLPTLNILIIEDSQADFLLVQRHLRQQVLDASCSRVESIEELREALDCKSWDIVLSDYHVPKLDFIESLAYIGSRFPDLPVILVSGLIGEEHAIELLKLGVSDFILKDNLTRLVSAVQRAIKEKQGLHDKRRAEEELAAERTLLRTLINTIPDLVWLKNAEGVYLECNPEFEGFFGASRAEIIGKSDYDYVDRELADFFRENDRKAMAAGGSSANDEWVTYASDGHRALLETIKTPMYDSRGHLMGVLGIARDITAIKQTEQALKESEQFNQQIINNAEEGIVVYGRDLRYRSWNPYMERLSGRAQAEVIGRYPLELFPFLKDGGVIERLEGILGGQPASTVEFPFESPFNSYAGWSSDTSSPLKNADGEIIGVIGMVRDISVRKQAEDSLRKLYVAVEQSPVSVMITDLHGSIEFVNPRFTKVTGYSSEEAIGRNPRIQKGDTPAEMHCSLWATITAGRVWEGDFHNRRKDGTLFWEHATISPIRNEAGEITHFMSIKEDITERRSLEGQLRQSQKMEAIGTLAGGIAHDFNNILTAIIGYTTLLQMEVKLSGTPLEYLNNLMALSERAGNLTKGLLAFSRNQVMSPRPVNLNEIVTMITKLVGRLIGEQIAVETHLASTPLIIKADSGQIEQVLMNLATNARDAMPDGGRLMLSTSVVNLEAGNRLLIDSAQPGAYALLTLSDTGCGMDQVTISRIFEPFFTTKEVGKGTGLGLSILHGIIKQHHGLVTVASTPGSGSTFSIYLPLVAETDSQNQGDRFSSITGGTETVLLAEDDAAILSVVSNFLTQFGYRVIEAVDGEQAVTKFRENAAAISVVILDMIMPRMNGREAFDSIIKIRPGVATVFVSGYPADLIRQREILPEGTLFLPKPVSPFELLRSVRQLLDGQNSVT
jgi:two-component system NtrC family sensor kinase